jgi:hypothetical protein
LVLWNTLERVYPTTNRSAAYGLAFPCSEGNHRKELPDGHYSLEQPPRRSVVHFPQLYVTILCAERGSDRVHVAPLPEGTEDVVSPQGTVPEPFSFALSQVNGTQLAGGSVKVVDSSNFKISSTIAMAEVTVEPGAMRRVYLTVITDQYLMRTFALRELHVSFKNLRPHFAAAHRLSVAPD